MNQSTNPYVMLHDEKRCIGCQAFTVACKVLNDVPEGFSRLQVQNRSPEHEPEVLSHFQFVRVSCQHCEDAPCVSVCPTGASFRDENGIVQVDKSRCIGCDYCVAACPFHVRYLNPQTGIADKCNFCADTRLEVGQSPACVSVCPTDALKFGRRDDPEIQHWINQKEVYRQQDTRSGPVSVYRRKEIHQEGNV
ncbi:MULTISPECIES: thiosulfate reductase electron transport protein PhsB [unclassified Citrobacter]|uniref:thiosulfate reductase electron transport protein PhsB n=1 Tax=unclassified Citrobacter TaxID=2644389 RepID=UPI0015EAD2AD|nr:MULTISPECIES: thiosulfate reductase electron transport protein PhsB [unclassified Citrobacter]MBA7876862.1 thiosulfate reductase electron transport protein PhsB [Citrobacter sp. RHBSTW-00827]MBA7938096.1 thiosulfate reductase electron transport protein PhsB [Citrobacter sp. RHBSTW-00509]QLS94183.1 thiosulfate reductase electron transport protein PhsB [Citrobacter sp. RHBSTW-00859]QLT53570.1 thiosulfate reductase electron transport protein PhsB [Citrobacter sp. RHBSTW-00821]QLU29854.1 thiosu